MKTRVPRTLEEFENYWQASLEFSDLQREMSDHQLKFLVGSDVALNDFKEDWRAM